VGTPFDFITFHAKGDPKLVNGVVRMDIGRQLRHINKGFEIIASYPTLKKLPIIIGESDPEGCAACSEDVYPHNAYRNGTLYSSYTAASFARKYDLAQQHGVNLRGVVTWAFEFEDQPWFRGFRDMATNGVDKPVLNVFRMFGLMEGDRVTVNKNLAFDYKLITDSGVRGSQPDVNALAAKSDRTATVMIWNYHDDNKLDLPSSPISLKLKGLAAKQLLLTHYRIDQEHSNAYTAWKKMGSPQSPSEAQFALLEKAGQLELLRSPEWMRSVNGEIQLNFDLPRQGVSLLRITW
jgi:xylan 1,4-beta-xylosidase